jgi:hypothetical protein
MQHTLRFRDEDTVLLEEHTLAYGLACGSLPHPNRDGPLTTPQASRHAADRSVAPP